MDNTTNRNPNEPHSEGREREEYGHEGWERERFPRLELNGPAPDFNADTTHGRIQLGTWQRDKWVVLFSHPSDFTPVCTTEFVEFGRRYGEFEKRNIALLGLSVDSVYSHIAWMRSIEGKFDVRIKFPVIADLDRNVSRLYGMLYESDTREMTGRCVYFIDPKRVVRAMLHYPLNVGRNTDEILRISDALQLAERMGVACPANWQPGQDVVIPAPATTQLADERSTTKEYTVKEWYYATKRM